MKIINNIKTGFRDVVLLGAIPIAKVAEWIPKNKKIWVFGCWGGKQYSDNSKYEFEYINRVDPDIRAVWITRDKNVLNEVRKKGYEAYSRHSIMGVWCCIRAKVAFITEDRHDISRILISGAKVIQLWHGMGIKDITNFFPEHESWARQIYISKIHSHDMEYWMTACREANEKYGKAFHLSSKRMFITGQPKDDMFIVIKNNTFIDNLRKKYPGCKVIGYLPTHRYFGQHVHQEMHSYKTLIKVNEILRQKNMVMIFKPHIHEFEKFKSQQMTELSNIVFAFDSIIFGDVYQYLPLCDALITDYSGIMLGYLTGEKPIVYFAFDYEDYISDDAGFYFDYKSVVAGPICMTWEETIDLLDRMFINDDYKELRNKMRKRFSPYNDGKNRKRVYETVKRIVSSQAK